MGSGRIHRSHLGWGVLPVFCLAAFFAGVPPRAQAAAPGCVLTFRHGGTVEADQCEDLGEAVAYARFGGWVVVLKSAVGSVQDEKGVTNLFPLWTPEESRARTEALPRQGGVPVAPSRSEPEPPPPPPQPTVVYYPVPVPAPYPSPDPTVSYGPVYPVYPLAAVPCFRCFPKPFHPVKPAANRVVPTDPSNIGPMAIQKSFPPISPIR
jgi:hypothetical protein